MQNELPTEAGLWRWRKNENSEWQDVALLKAGTPGDYYDRIMGCPVSRWVEYYGTIGQWLRIPDADTLARMEAWWNVRGDITCPSCGSRRDTPADYDSLPVEMVEGDPINAAYREAIKAEDVPEWAVWVAIDKGGLVNYFTVEPRHLNVTWELCDEAAWAELSTKITRERMKSIDWTQTLRRVDAVWPELKKGGA